MLGASTNEFSIPGVRGVSQAIGRMGYGDAPKPWESWINVLAPLSIVLAFFIPVLGNGYKFEHAAFISLVIFIAFILYTVVRMALAKKTGLFTVTLNLKSKSRGETKYLRVSPQSPTVPLEQLLPQGGTLVVTLEGFPPRQLKSIYDHLMSFK